MLSIFAQMQYHTANSDCRFFTIDLFDVMIWEIFSLCFGFWAQELAS